MSNLSLLPPGPRWSVLQPLAYAKSPYRYLTSVRARYGDPFTVCFPARTVMTGHPDGVRQIFTAPLDTFCVLAPKSIQRVLGAQDLRTLGGEPHRRARKVITPGFQGGGLDGIGTMVRETTVQALQRWRDGETMEIYEALHDITLKVILKTVFGVDQGAGFESFRKAVENLAASWGSPTYLLSAALSIDSDSWPPNRRVDIARRNLAGLLLDDIAERRASGENHKDILSRLMKARFEDGSEFSDAHLVDSLLTNLLAGRTGTALLLSWAFAWMGRHSDVADRIQQEIDGLDRHDNIDRITALPYLDALLKECLRLYPQVPLVVRGLAKPLELRGYEIPAGVTVAACSAVLHMDPEIYPDPERFLPDRFLRRNYNGYEFIPFGGGYKMCIGYQFAILQVKVMLATLLSIGRFTVLDQGPLRVKYRGLVMGPSQVRVRFHAK